MILKSQNPRLKIMPPSPHRVVRGEPFRGNIPQETSDIHCYMTSLLVPPVWNTVKEMWDNQI